MAYPIFLALLLAAVVLPAHAQTGSDAGRQDASTAPGLRYGSELLLGRSHAQGEGQRGVPDRRLGAGEGNGRERVVLRRHGAETMPAIQAGQINPAARLQVQEPKRPVDNRLLSKGGGPGGRSAIIPFGGERTVEGGGQGAGSQGGERLRLAAFPPRDPSTAPGAVRSQTQPGQAQPRPSRQAPSASAPGARPTPPQARPAPSPAQAMPPPPAARSESVGNAPQGILSRGNRFSEVAHQDLSIAPILSEETRAALDRLNPRQQEVYRTIIRTMARSNLRRPLSEHEIRFFLEIAQSR